MSIFAFIRPYQLLTFKKKVTFRQLFPFLIPRTHMLPGQMSSWQSASVKDTDVPLLRVAKNVDPPISSCLIMCDLIWAQKELISFRSLIYGPIQSCVFPEAINLA